MKRVLYCSLVLGLVSIAGCSTDTTLTGDAGVVLPDLGMGGSDTGTATVDTGMTPNDMGMRMRPDLGPPTDSGPPEDLGNILPPNDAGSPFGDSGALGDPQWVDLTVITDGNMCTPLTPCGGNIVGTWDVSGGCFAFDLSQIMRCPGATASATGRARGRVVFSATTATRVAESQVTLQASIPPSFCTSLGGGCTGIQTQLQMRVPNSACVMQTDGGCYCQAQYDYVINDMDGYTTMNNEIIGATSGKTWEYCVMGNMLSYDDNSPMGMREPGIIDLTMR